ncbi:MAG: hypothetical protein RR721_03200 [Aeromonas sp.]|uniref:hypothetical protein n=1 Tax=Aeromonas sp. TaxID=647 RepID=UPI002FCABCC4
MTNPLMATFSGALWRLLGMENLPIDKKAPYKTHQNKQITKHNLLYIKKKSVNPSTHICTHRRKDDKTPTKIQKRTVTSQALYICHIIAFFIVLPDQYGILVSSKVSKGRQNNERVRCYRRFYRVFHSGCRLSALAGAALSRLIDQNIVRLPSCNPLTLAD